VSVQGLGMAGKSLPLGLTRASIEALAFMLDLGVALFFALPVASQQLPANPRQMLLVLLLFSCGGLRQFR